MYHMTKEVQAVGGTIVVCSIVIVGALTHCALFYSVYDLKTTKMNMKCNLIWELMLHEFK